MVAWIHGTHTESIRTDCASPAGAARQREDFEPQSAQRNSVGCRTRLQVARTAGAFRQMAHCLYENEPLVQEWGSRPGVRAASEGRNSGGQSRRGLAGQYDCQGASGRDWSVEKTDPQSIGRSHGGLTTKIHMVAADERTPVIFSLSGGQALTTRPKAASCWNDWATSDPWASIRCREKLGNIYW